MDSSRTIFLAALAILLPTIIFSSVIVAFNTYYDRAAVEDATMDRTRQLIGDIDARLAMSAGALQVLATSHVLTGPRPAEARARLAEVLAIDRAWRSVTLLNLQTGAAVVTTDAAGVPAIRPADLRTRR